MTEKELMVILTTILPLQLLYMKKLKFNESVSEKYLKNLDIQFIAIIIHNH